MKLSSKELKRQARETLSGHYGLPMGAFVITELIVLAVDLPFNLMMQNPPTQLQMIVSSLANIIISLLSIVLSCGLTYIHMNLARKKQTSISDLFCFFSKRPDRFILSGLLLMGIMILIMIPAAICTVAAILLSSVSLILLTAVIWIITCVFMLILSYSYGLVYYILIDEPDCSILSAFRKSRSLMRGNKGRMFYISFSFLGMILLSLLSLGIGLLWVVPYINQTMVEFYRNVTGELPVEPNTPVQTNEYEERNILYD